MATVDKNGPPTENQLARINQLLDDPRMEPHLNSLTDEKFERFLKTASSAGILINWMKKKISDEEKVRG
jgi:hypothetical protein